MKLDYKFLILSLIIFFIIIFDKLCTKEIFTNAEYSKEYLEKLNLPELKNLYAEPPSDIEKRMIYDLPKSNGEEYKNLSKKSILRNYRVNEFTSTYTSEISFKEIIKITNSYDFIKKYDLNKKEINKEDIGKHFVDLFNKKFNNFNLNNKYHMYDKRKYEVKKINYILEESYQEYKKIYYEILIYKEDKNYGLLFQNTVIINENILQYNNVEIIGIENLEDMNFNKAENYDIKKLDKCEFNIDIKKDECNKLIYENNVKLFNDITKKEKASIIDFCIENNITNEETCLFLSGKFLDPHLKKYYDDKKIEEDLHKEYLKYKCFNNDGYDKKTCLSFNNHKNNYGVWDKPCKENSECPFYLKNKNYPNLRGGCVNGYCEMPINIKRIGYTKYDPNHKPFCRNCNIKNCVGKDCYTCCEEQKDVFKYPNLVSPDYIFKNDN